MLFVIRYLMKIHLGLFVLAVNFFIRSVRNESMSFEANVLKIARRRKYREQFNKTNPQTTLENYSG